MSWLFEDDICWCYNSQLVGELGCNKTKCFRHMSNRRNKEGIFTCSYFKDTPECPYDEVEEGK